MSSSAPCGQDSYSAFWNVAMRMRLSQGHLNLLETCPRRFQHTYLDRLSLPVNLDQQDSLHWGNRFHRLMQQWELGLPIDALADADQMQQCVQALVEAAPDLFQPHSACFRQSEHRRSLEYGGYGLTVVYDLLVLAEDAQILDWKTYPRPQQSQHLACNWQTRLYPFVLAETSDYAPDQISMTYWFVQAKPAGGRIPCPQCVRFQYSAALHREIQQTLDRLLHQLSELIDNYETGRLFPQVDAADDRCGYCHYVARCQREAAAPDGGIGLAAIAEISLEEAF